MMFNLAVCFRRGGFETRPYNKSCDSCSVGSPDPTLRVRYDGAAKDDCRPKGTCKIPAFAEMTSLTSSRSGLKNLTAGIACGVGSPDPTQRVGYEGAIKDDCRPKGTGKIPAFAGMTKKENWIPASQGPGAQRAFAGMTSLTSSRSGLKNQTAGIACGVGSPDPTQRVRYEGAIKDDCHPKGTGKIPAFAGMTGLVIKLLAITILISSIVFANDTDLRQYHGRIIRKIEIVRKNVFEDQSKDGSFFVYKWADAIHVKTKERIVRRELLFAEGDSLDEERVLESQRNIRMAQFIEDVVINASPVGADSVDLKVTTIDLWTTELAPNIQTGGGNYKIGILFAEKNFLGTGQLVEVTGETGKDQKGLSFYYQNRRLIGSRIEGIFNYSNFTYGKNYYFQLDRPQYSLKIHSTFATVYSHSTAQNRLFYSGIEYFRYNSVNDGFHSQASYSFGERNRLNLTAAYDYFANKYSPYYSDTLLNNHLIPHDEILSYPSIGIGVGRVRYGVERYIDEAGTPEDLTFGPSIGFSFGKSLKSLGADIESWISGVSARFLVKPFNNLIVGGISSVSWRGQGGQSQRIRNISEGYIYLKTTERQVLAIHALTDFAWRQPSSYQVLLGGDNGLRGYPYFKYSGTKLALGNIEYRIYLPFDLLTVRLGGAAFFDCGNVWRASQKVDLTQMKSDVGVGLRLGLVKSATARILSFDIARALTEKHYFIAISGTLVFDLEAFGR